jgi:hypothetical protein
MQQASVNETEACSVRNLQGHSRVYFQVTRYFFFFFPIPRKNSVPKQSSRRRVDLTRASVITVKISTFFMKQIDFIKVRFS